MTLALSIIYDSDAYFKRYQELRTYHIEIPRDIVAVGFNGMYVLYSQLQEYKSRVTGIFNDALNAKADSEAQLEAAEYAYNAALDVLLDTDPEILALPSDKMKVARANRKLKTQLETLHQAKIVHIHIDAYFKTVQSTLKDLESTNKNLTEAVQLFKRALPSPGLSGNQPQGGKVYTGL